MDNIQISGIRAYGYIGALPEEQVLGQWFEVTLTLWLDLSVAGQSDRLSDTHDYVSVVQATQKIIQTQKYALLEKLAEQIAQTALAYDQRLSQVKVKLTKLTPPIANFDGQITVEITRTPPER
ncbi:MAG: dihydroneopterin aldolase [Leptolyngbyaceae cyanobacterium SM1_1_3]|nr:dihydroneopterin aldolase [Leptolyngbyaceae cyanobacterium SM1_1_3]NJN03883.1 dihydroneopterin aldolase [Leptolyngbyaceae cyanobacterium RM1_1_2]